MGKFNNTLQSTPAATDSFDTSKSGTVALPSSIVQYLMTTKPSTPPKATAPAQANGGAGAAYGPSPATPQAPVQAQAAPIPAQSDAALASALSHFYTTPAPALRPMNTAMTPTVTPAQPDFASRVPMAVAGNGGSGVPAAGAGWMPNPNLTAVLGNLSAAIGGPRSVYGQIGGQIAGVAQSKLFSDYINKVMGGGTSGSPFANASFYGLSPDLQAKAAEVGLAMSGAPLTDLVKAAQADYYSAMADETRAPKQMTGNRFEDFDFNSKYDRWTGRLVPISSKPVEPRFENVQEGGQSVTYLVPPGATDKKDFIEIGRGPKWDPSSGAQANEVAMSRWLQYYKAAKATGWQSAATKYKDFLQLDPATNEPVWMTLNEGDRQKVIDYANSVYEQEIRKFQADKELPASYHGVESLDVIKARLILHTLNGVQQTYPGRPDVRLFIDPITKKVYPDPKMSQ